MNEMFPFDTEAVGGERMCGAGRTAGGVYLECGLSAGGRPIEEFLIDPPVPVNPDDLGLSHIGVMITNEGHVIDWIGESHYPYPADFVEEVRRMGVSRKVSQTTDFSKLAPGAMLIFAHAKAVCLNPEVGLTECPSGLHGPGELCASLMWSIPEAGEEDCGTRPLVKDHYEVHHNADTRFAPGLFLAVPLTNISIISDDAGQVDQDLYTKVSESGFTPHIASS